MKKLVVIDTETGGLDPAEHSILTLGATILDGDSIVGSFHMVIREENLSLTPEAMRVNGLTQVDLDSGKSPSFVVTAFEEWLHAHGIYGRQTLAGHNIAGFDMGFLKRLYKLAGKRMPFDYHVVDSMSVALVLKFLRMLPVQNVKLDTLCAHFGIKIREDGVSGRHNSQEDAVATAKLLRELFLIVKPNEPIVG